ncbi:MAG: hypothetical protein JRG91_00490 [Deltaproteobacteria bacterium]|nr:hypothetical protein [Deltaproteobacteria bacterium]
MIGAIKQTPFETVTIEKTASRQTPKPQSGAFAEVLKQGAMALLGAAGGVASALPCGGIVSAAVRSGAATAASAQPAGLAPAGEDPRAPAPAANPASAPSGRSDLDEMWALQEAGVRSNLEVLQLQERISRESRVFSTLSNVMKARHETARNAIGNIR